MRDEKYRIMCSTTTTWSAIRTSPSSLRARALRRGWVGEVKRVFFTWSLRYESGILRANGSEYQISISKGPIRARATHLG